MTQSALWHSFGSSQAEEDDFLVSKADPALKFLTLSEVAGALQVSKRTLFRLIYQKRIPALKVGGQWRVSESRFKEWIRDADITLGPE